MSCKHQIDDRSNLQYEALMLAAPIRDLFEAGDIDLGVIRREGGNSDGEVPLVWRASPDWEVQRGIVPLVNLPPPCGVRAVR